MDTLELVKFSSLPLFSFLFLFFFIDYFVFSLAVFAVGTQPFSQSRVWAVLSDAHLGHTLSRASRPSSRPYSQPPVSVVLLVTRLGHTLDRASRSSSRPCVSIVFSTTRVGRILDCSLDRASRPHVLAVWLSARDELYYGRPLAAHLPSSTSRLT